MSFLHTTQSRAAAQRHRLGLVQRAQHRLAVLLAEWGFRQCRQEAAARLPEGGHSELAITRADHLGERDQGRRQPFSDQTGIVEMGLPWQHWNGSDWIDIDLAKLPGAGALRKQGS